MTMLVAIPTVDGREDHLARCVEAYRATCPVESVRTDDDFTYYHQHADSVELRIYRNRATCGAVWNEAATDAAADGCDLLHCTADDLDPTPGWYEASCAILALGCAPAHRIVTARPDQPDVIESWGMDWGGSGNVHAGQRTTMTRIPTVRLDWWRNIPPVHYFSDNAVSTVLTVLGVPIVLADATFRHHWAQAGRQAGGGARFEAERAEWSAFDETARRSPASIGAES